MRNIAVECDELRQIMGHPPLYQFAMNHPTFGPAKHDIEAIRNLHGASAAAPMQQPRS